MRDITLRGNVLLQERSDNVGHAGVAHGVEMQAVALPEQVTRAGVSACQWEVCCDADHRGVSQEGCVDFLAPRLEAARRSFQQRP